MSGQILKTFHITIRKWCEENVGDGLNGIIKKIIGFRGERDWQQFHDPKNLAGAISIEAGELLENFLWMSVEESKETRLTCPH